MQLHSTIVKAVYICVKYIGTPKEEDDEEVPIVIDLAMIGGGMWYTTIQNV